MKTYNTTYKFINNDIVYEAKINGTVFNKTEEGIDMFHKSTLKNSFCLNIFNAIFNSFDYEAEMIESNANNAYAIKTKDDIFPISINAEIRVLSDPIHLLMQG